MIIVTGAAGFIGSNIIAALNERGRGDILAVDNAEIPAETLHLHALKVQSFLARPDLPAWLEKNARAVDGIIHMGACSDTTQSDRAFMLSNNTDYTRKLWDFCAHHQKRFVYASSAATYGDGSLGYDDAADPKRLKPLNLYGESKQLFDLFALEQKQTPLGWAGLKFFNVYGPRENHKGRMASVAFHSFNQIRETGKVRLFKSDRPGIPDGGQQRDFIYVNDCVAAILHFFNRLINADAFKERELFASFYPELTALTKDHYEQQAFIYLDIISWVKSKVNNLTLEQVVTQSFEEMKK